MYDIVSIFSFIAASAESEGKQRPWICCRPSFNIPQLYVASGDEDLLLKLQAFAPQGTLSHLFQRFCTPWGKYSFQWWNVAVPCAAILGSILSARSRRLVRSVPLVIIAVGSLFFVPLDSLSWRDTSTPPLALQHTDLEILEQPQSLTLSEGHAATFKVRVNGLAEFQWIRDGMPVLHETSASLHIPSVGKHHLGAYVVKVTHPTSGQRRLSEIAWLQLSAPKNPRLHMIFPEEGPWVTDWAFAKMDIIFVHDMWGDFKQSWTNRKGELWPSDFIRDQYPYVRSLSYDYPGNPSFWLDNAEHLGLQDRAKNMLDCLIAKDVGRRPIVFIGHGMGGILVKLLLVHASNSLLVSSQAHSVFQYTVGVVFYAVPNLGASVADFGNLLAQVFRIAPAARELAPLTQSLMELNGAFGRLCVQKSIRTRSFSAAEYVGRPVVPEWSANPQLPTNDHTILSTSHAEITKPENWQDERYSHFTHFLSSLLAERNIGLDCPWSPHYRA